MSYEIDIRCNMSGNDFSPKRTEKSTGLKFEEKIEIGDLVLKGKLKNTLAVTGSATLVANSKQDNCSDYSLIEFIKLLSKNIDTLKSYGVQNFDLVLGIFYEDQCNFSFSPYLINLLNQIGLVLNVSCYQVEK